MAGDENELPRPVLDGWNKMHYGYVMDQQDLPVPDCKSHFSLTAFWRQEASVRREEIQSEGKIDFVGEAHVTNDKCRGGLRAAIGQRPPVPALERD